MAADWVDYATVSMTDAITPKLSARYTCYTDGTDIACNSPSIYVSTDGSIGIGTANPQSQLHISGSSPFVLMTDAEGPASHRVTMFGNDDGNFRIQARDSAGTFVANDYLIDRGPAGASMHIWRISNSEVMRVGSGNAKVTGTVSVTSAVQLGDSSLACTAPINGAIKYAGGSLYYCAGTTWTAVGAAGVTTAASSTGAVQFNSGGVLAGDTSNLFWDIANNRLGVGTSLPSATVHASGTFLSDMTALGYGFYTAKNNNHLTQNAYYNGSSWRSYGPAADYGSAVLFQTAGRTGQALSIFVDNSVSAANEALSFSRLMTVRTTGEVGIGENLQSPTATLQVSGSFTVSTSAQTTTPSLYVEANGNVGIGTSAPSQALEILSTSAVLKMKSTAASKAAAIALLTNSHQWNINATATDQFQIQDATAPATRLTIDTSGNVGIGTISPSAKLDVTGNVSVSGLIDVGHSALACSTTISGSIRYEITSDTLQICTGSGWKSLVSGSVAGADNLGNHTATQALDMAGYAINAAGTVSGTAFYSGDGNAYFYNNGSIPSLVLDTNDYFRFTRATNTLDWLIGGTPKMTVDSAGKLGIFGNSDPQAALDATGGTVSATTHYGSNGSVSVPTYSFSNDSNMGIYRAAPDVLGFSVGAANVVSVSSAGIGTSGIAVAGDITATGVISASGFVIGANSPAATGAIRYNGTSDTLQVYTGSGWKSLTSTTIAATSAASGTGAIQFNSGGSFAGDTSNLFWDDANNRLGIGTMSPATKLHLEGQLRIGATNYPRIEHYLSDTSVWSVGPRASSDYYIYRESPSGNVLIPNGNVGIGTTQPDERLVVVGATSDGSGSLASFYNSAGVLKSTINDRGAQDWYLQDSTNLERGSIRYSTPAGTPGIIFFNSSGTGRSQLRLLSSTGGLSFGATADASIPGDQMVLTPSGRIGIGGSVTPTANLQIGTEYISTSSEIMYVTGNGAHRRAWSTGVRYGAVPVNPYYDFVIADRGPSGTSDSIRMLIDWGTGYMGIGTVTPTTHVDVSGSISSTNAIQVGTSSLPCSAGIPGAIRYNAGSLEYCNGTVWADLVSGTAGNVTGTGSANHVAFWSGASALTYDSSQLYWDATNNRLGIGTNVPTEALTVTGKISTTGEIAGNLIGGGHGQFRAVSANSASPSVVFRNDGGNFYLLLTANNDPYGSWNSLRPFMLNLATGDVLMAANRFAVSHSTGQVSATNYLASPNDSAAAPSYSWGSDTNTGMFNTAGDTIGFSTNGTEAMRIDASNRVGINTSTPGSQLDVNGVVSATTLRVSSNVSGNDILRYETADYPLIEQISDRGGLKIASFDDMLYFGNGDVARTISETVFNPDAENIVMASDGSVYIVPGLQYGWGSQSPSVFTSNGRLGVGDLAPLAQLEVSGTISSTNAIQVGTSTLPCSAGIPGAIRYNAGSLEYCNGVVWADLVSGTASSVGGTGSANHVAYWTGASTLGYDNSQLYWDATNNRLGIGTASPGTNLGIAGSVSATGNLNVAGRIGIATSAVAAVPLEISGTENIRLVKTGGGSNPYVSWYNDGSRQGYMGYGTKNSDFDITTENGTRLDLTGANGIALTATAGEIAANDRLIIASNARMTGATSNSIAWSTIGVAAPGAGSAGMKLQLYGGTSNIMATSDYALGIEGGNLWLNTGGGIKFYAGSTLRAEMASTGTISATAFHASNGDSAAAPGHTWIGDVNTGIFHPVADVIGVSINGTERSRIFSTGISTTGVFYAGNGSTATPAFNFHSDLNTGMYRAGTDIIGFSTNGVERARIVAGGISTSGVYYSGNGTAAAPAHTFSGDTNNGMFLATTDALGLSTAGTERMRIAANGRVGIGVTVPTAELSVAGSLDTTGNGTFGGFDFRLGNADQSTRGDSGASRALVKYSGAVLGINWSGDFTGGTVVAGYGNSNNLYVSGAANGNVGIGTASPADRLHLDNTDNTYVRIDGGNGYMGVKLTDDGVLKWQIYNSGGTSDRFYVVDKDTNNGVYINQDASAWTANSDRRLKTNIQDYSVLDKIDNGFRAVTFDWKSGGKRDFGVVAQEIYKAFPEVVDKGTDDLEKTISDTTDKSVWGVKYDRLGVLALEGVRELKAENDKLHRLLKAANDNDAALRQQLDELRHDLRELKRAQHAD